MRRREVVAALVASAALCQSGGSAQTQPKRPLIGFLGSGSKAGTSQIYSGFPQGMREFNYVESRDYAFEDRYSDGNPARLNPLAEGLIRLKPDVVVTSNNAAALAIRRLTSSIPIVCALMIDPVGAGLVVSERRPGTNVTGLLIRLEGLTGKQLEIALDLLPGVGKIGLLVNSGNPSNAVQQREAEDAAKQLGIALAAIEVQTADQLGPAFQAFADAPVKIVVILADAMFSSMRRQIGAFALVARLPTIYSFREMADYGAMISYGINQRENFRRAAYFVDRILKGDQPSDLPIEFPAKLELVINLSTSRALGLAVPPTLLARADEVIE
jgi:putative ABC transport system substrate-binding protein